MIPNYEIQAILAEQISKVYSNYRKIYTDGSVQRERAGAGAYTPLPLGSSILSAELCAIRLALDGVINYNIESENILCLSDSKSALLLIQNINRIANDQDLYNIRRLLLNLKIKGNEVYFQHIPCHKGIKYNHMAEFLAAKASMLIPSALTSIHEILLGKDPMLIT